MAVELCSLRFHVIIQYCISFRARSLRLLCGFRDVESHSELSPRFGGNHSMSTLRQEIVESQTARSEYLKLKVIVVAALGAAGLGLTDTQTTKGAYLVLALIPLVCFYVDLLCRHIQLRIIVIGTFLRLTATGEEAAYERFVGEATQMGPARKTNVFALEDWALEGSTIALSLVIVVAAFFLPDLMASPAETIGLGAARISVVQFGQFLYGCSGLATLGLTIAAQTRSRRRRAGLVQLAGKHELVKEIREIHRSTIARESLPTEVTDGHSRP